MGRRTTGHQDNLQRDLYSNACKIGENINEMYDLGDIFLGLEVLTIFKMLYLHFYKTIFGEISET